MHDVYTGITTDDEWTSYVYSAALSIDMHTVTQDYELARSVLKEGEILVARLLYCNDSESDLMVVNGPTHLSNLERRKYNPVDPLINIKLEGARVDLDFMYMKDVLEKDDNDWPIIDSSGEVLPKANKRYQLGRVGLSALNS